jgi:hypothetical protein
MRALSPVLLAPGLLALLLLAGCKLIDQRTFASPGAAPTSAQVAPAALPPLPLVTIRFDDPDVDFRPVLAQAIEAVQARKENADFEVVAVVPANAPPEVQDRFVRDGSADTSRVATTLAELGVDPARVHVGFREDAGSPPRQVLVFVH